jgi:hypothetical protein
VIPIHSRIVRKSEDLVLYGATPARRIMFFVLFLMLASAMIAGFDMETDVSGWRLLKTGGYAAVLLVLLGAAGWSGTTSFDRGSGRIETISKLFGVTVRRKPLAGIDDVDRLLLQKVTLLQDGPPGGRRGVFGNLFEPRAELLRLFLETNGGRISLDEGSNAEALEQTAVFFAEFLGVEFSQEELEP